MTRRLSLPLALALLLGLVAGPIRSSVAGAAPTTVVSIGSVADVATIAVSGKAAFGGLDLVAVGTDQTGDGQAELGLDLTGALIGQPNASSGDLVFALSLAQLPATGGIPEGVRYTWDFGVKDVAGQSSPVVFQLSGKLTDASGGQSTRRPAFMLRGNCQMSNGIATCVDIEGLGAAVDTESKQIRITVPRRTLEGKLNASLAGTSIVPAIICDGISARLSAQAGVCTGAGTDILTQAPGTAFGVATRSVRIAVAPAGETPDFSAAPEAALTPDGKFNGFLDLAGVEGSDHVWARACFGSNCGNGNAELGTPAPGLIERWDPPVLVHQTQAHRETSLALSPTNPNLKFICDPSGVPATANGQSYFHRSTNGGTSWAPIDVEGPQTDPRNYAFEGGDCDVAFDEGGTMYTADTWLGNLSVGHSKDGGQTWDGTALAVSAPIVDRPWLVGGPAGTVHLSYQDLQCCMPSAIWYTRSTDFGKTFLPAVPVADAGPNGAFTWEGNFAVSPDGNDLYLVYTRRQGPALLTGLEEQGPETVWVAASHDGGVTWNSTLVASMPNPASYLYPSIAMDAGGFLHVVFSSKTATDRPIWYSSSKDAGKTWLAPVPILSGAAGVAPWIAGGAPGEAAITWLGSPDPAAYDNASYPWYFYWARVTGGDTASPTFTAGTTTTTPMFTGAQVIPEFENVRLDKDGLIHIGMSVYRKVGAQNRWAIYYQRESR